MITITESAAKKAHLLMQGTTEEEAVETSAEHGLRMQVIGGGCSGFQYNLGFDELRSGDKVFEQHGLKVFIDSRSTLYLAGSTLDYNDGLMESGFKITNPNARSECGCGESFSV